MDLDEMRKTQREMEFEVLQAAREFEAATEVSTIITDTVIEEMGLVAQAQQAKWEEEHRRRSTLSLTVHRGTDDLSAEMLTALRQEIVYALIRLGYMPSGGEIGKRDMTLDFERFRDTGGR